MLPLSARAGTELGPSLLPCLDGLCLVSGFLA